MKVEFFEWIFEQQKQTNEIITNHFNKKLKTTIEDEENYQNSQDCWICSKEIIKNNDKVRDQCHITGKYTGSAHRECNSKLKIPKNVPIIFHNLDGYDRHLIFRELNKFKNIDIYPKKDAYPYEWVDSDRKFIYPRLPPKEAFYSTLDDGKSDKGGGHISNGQFSH